MDEPARANIASRVPSNTRCSTSSAWCVQLVSGTALQGRSVLAQKQNLFYIINDRPSMKTFALLQTDVRPDGCCSSLPRSRFQESRVSLAS